jgi:hypothetical protein
MKVTLNKITTSVATLFISAVLVMTLPRSLADEYCIKYGGQVGFGCGYPTMEECRARSSGISGTCMLTSSAQSPSDALAYQPKQPNTRSTSHLKKEPAER